MRFATLDLFPSVPIGFGYKGRITEDLYFSPDRAAHNPVSTGLDRRAGRQFEIRRLRELTTSTQPFFPFSSPSVASRAPEHTGPTKNRSADQRRPLLLTGPAARGPRYADARTSRASLTRAPRATSSQRRPTQEPPHRPAAKGRPDRAPRTDRRPPTARSGRRRRQATPTRGGPWAAVE